MQSGPNGTTVNLIPVMNGTTFKEWNMSMGGGKAEGPGNYPVVHVHPTSGSPVTYTIVNPPTGVTFDTTNPVYIQAGTTKPTSGVDSQFTYQLSANHQGQANTVLTLTDSNQTQGDYTYVMNFTGGVSQLDPIIDNSGPHVMSYDYVWYGLGAALVLALLVLILKPKFRKSDPVERP